MSSDKQGKLRLELVDVFGDKLGGKVDVMLRHQVLSHSPRFNGLDASKTITIKGLHGNPQGRYMLEVDPSAYLQVTEFVTIQASGFTDKRIVFPIDPKKVKKVVFPEYPKLVAELQRILEASDNVFSFEGRSGKALYTDKTLDDKRKACVLNIAAKCEATRLSNGKTVLPYVQKIRELRSERFFADVSRELREETKNSVADDVFKDAPDTLHTPPAGFERAGSWKTRDQYGNLQLTFFAKGDEWVADIDIDDAAGIEHLFHVLDHKITGKDTDPFAIHQILMARQGIDPGYRFVV
ncbi:MAG TPA: hypothetical protein VLU47_09215 [Blastocatellia bacterium]|nr:hypothetical protein [Blastocatellia bacterium]